MKAIKIRMNEKTQNGLFHDDGFDGRVMMEDTCEQARCKRLAWSGAKKGLGTE
jgi:hypothetical protein